MPGLPQLSASWKLIAAAFLLTAATRIGLQSLTGVPLTAGATAVVAAFWLAMSAAVRGLWQRRSAARRHTNQASASKIAFLAIALTAANPPQLHAQPESLCLEFASGVATGFQSPDWAERQIRRLANNPDVRWQVTGSAGESEAATPVPGLLLAKRRAQSAAAWLAGLGVSERSISIAVSSDRPPDCGARVSASDESGEPIALGIPLETEAPGPPGPSDPLRATGRDYLISGQREAPGFGLYTYLLFPQKPAAGDAAAHARLHSALEGFLRAKTISDVVETIRNFEDAVDLRRLNIWYLPVQSKPAVEKPETLLEQYDWAVAEFFCQRAGRVANLGGAGPYLVSSRTPLSARTTEGHVLVQDLSRVPAGPLMTRWLDLYMRKAQQPALWAKTDLREQALRFQTELENLVPELKAAKDAIATVLLGWRQILGGG